MCQACDGRGFAGARRSHAPTINPLPELSVANEVPPVGRRRSGPAGGQRRTIAPPRDGCGAQGVGLVNFSDEQKILAARVRSRARHYLSHRVDEIETRRGDAPELVGGEGAISEEVRRRAVEMRKQVQGREALKDEEQGFTDMDSATRDSVTRCLRCTGLGYLSCMACSD